LAAVSLLGIEANCSAHAQGYTLTNLGGLPGRPPKMFVCVHYDTEGDDEAHAAYLDASRAQNGVSEHDELVSVHAMFSSKSYAEREDPRLGLFCKVAP
jgi:hypothetical protein